MYIRHCDAKILYFSFFKPKPVSSIKDSADLVWFNTDGNETRNKETRPEANYTLYHFIGGFGSKETGGKIKCVSYIVPGGLLRLPYIGFCLVSSRATVLWNCNARKKLILGLTVSESKSCKTNDKLYMQILVIWICAKLNYILLAFNLAFVVRLWYSLKVKINNNSINRCCFKLSCGYKNWFAATNVFWMIWRVQETGHLDTQWRNHVPYLCIITNYICYICQTGSLYMMALSSHERFKALSKPLMKPANRPVQIVIGFIMGLFTSSINLTNILTVDDPDVAKTCKMRNGNMSEASLLFLLICKILNLCLVYIVPAIFLICCNIATLVTINKKIYLTNSCMNRYKYKLNYNISFVVLCSLGMVCCLPKPILELLMVQRIFSSSDGTLTRSTGEVIADGVFMNLTVIAFMLNTAVGMKYSVH